MSRNVNFTNFTAEQMRFMVALADPDDHRTQKELAEELGVRPETLTRWKREPGFGEAVWELTFRNLESSIGRVSSVLLRQATQGDVRCLRLFFEVIGKVGSQRSNAICTRDHVASADDVADALHGVMTERQLNDYVQQVSDYYGIHLPDRTKIQVIDTDVRVEENIQLEVMTV